jgi:hypothetical protein
MTFCRLLGLDSKDEAHDQFMLRGNSNLTGVLSGSIILLLYGKERLRIWCHTITMQTSCFDEPLIQRKEIPDHFMSLQ